MKATAISVGKKNDSPRIAKRMQMNVDATAASCGDFSKGVAMKKDQDANDRLRKGMKQIRVRVR